MRRGELAHPDKQELILCKQRLPEKQSNNKEVIVKC